MKKLFTLLTLVGILFFNQKNYAQGTPSFTIQNFTSTCIKPTAPRQFTLKFTVTFSYSTNATSVDFTTPNGNFNSQPTGVNVTLTNNAAIVTLTYSEVTPQTTVPIAMVFKNGTNILYRPSSNQTLCTCGNFCATNFLNPAVIGGFGNSTTNNNQLATAIYPQAGPTLVVGTAATIDSTYRRTVCNGINGAWTATTFSPISGSQNFSTARDYNTQGSDFFIYSTTPAKLNPNCKEEFKYRVTVTVTFQNGCTKTVSKTVNAMRP